MSNVIEIIAKVLNVDVDIESSMENVEEWDSFNHVMIMIELKSEFDLDFNQEDFQWLTSVKNILKITEGSELK
jgi:acyl carrier protein